MKNRYEVVVVWHSGETDIYGYPTREEADRSADGYKKAFGSQVWVCVRDKQ